MYLYSKGLWPGEHNHSLCSFVYLDHDVHLLIPVLLISQIQTLIASWLLCINLFHSVLLISEVGYVDLQNSCVFHIF